MKSLPTRAPHDHTFGLSVATGTLWLWILLIATGLVVAAYALLRPFFGDLGRATSMVVTAAAALGGLLQLLLTDGIDVPRQVALVLLGGLLVPVVVARQRDARFDVAASRIRGFAPYVLLVAASGAGVEFTRAWLGPGEPSVSLHTGLAAALTGLAWFVIWRPRARLTSLGIHALTWLLACAVVAGTAQVANLSATSG